MTAGTKTTPVIFWFRSDLRLADNPALASACDEGVPVIPVFILDDAAAGAWARGGASRWWLHESLKALSSALAAAGFHPLVLMKGAAQQELGRLIDKTGARQVFWNRCYEPWATSRDTKIKQSLKDSGIDTHSFNGGLLAEPWEMQNKSGQSYKVFTPFYKAFLARGGIRPPLDAAKPSIRHAGAALFEGLSLDALGLMPRIGWYAEMARRWQPGEKGAHKRLAAFIDDDIGRYKASRDYPADDDGVSRLSPHLHFGEISPHQAWHAAEQCAARKQNLDHVQGWQRQLVWREFSCHLLYHAPDFPDRPWNKRFDTFPWQRDEDVLEKWRRGMTGYPIIDAGMRQLWQTGWMHNRVRMIVGSFLVKNLLQDWRAGEAWFWDTLVDADLANNAAGWQWIAGCGADAAPYFRIFNPVTQAKTYDPDGAYVRAYIPELKDVPDAYIHTPWEAPPMLRPKDYPTPMVDLATSRARALDAYAQSRPEEDAS